MSFLLKIFGIIMIWQFLGFLTSMEAEYVNFTATATPQSLVRVYIDMFYSAICFISGISALLFSNSRDINLEINNYENATGSGTKTDVVTN